MICKTTRKICLWLFCVLCLVWHIHADNTEIRIAQLIEGNKNALSRNYPEALPGLLESAAKATGLPLAQEPILINSFLDPRLPECPFLYINWDDKTNWDKLPEAEILAFRNFLTQGGFVFVDAGITASFLRNAENPFLGQHHSYAEWEASPPVRDFFQKVLPKATFQPLGRDDPLYACFYQGLPGLENLPPNVQDYAQREKWPDGTYSAVGIRLNGRLAVLATPVIAMGWGRNSLGGWTTEIRFRTLEDNDGLNRLLPQAATLGPQYDARREDGGTDHIFCQGDAMPAWLNDPLGNWRVFRYYDSRQISDYVHVFYTRLGTNFLIAALLGLP